MDAGDLVGFVVSALFGGLFGLVICRFGRSRQQLSKELSAQAAYRPAGADPVPDLAGASRQLAFDHRLPDLTPVAYRIAARSALR